MMITKTIKDNQAIKQDRGKVPMDLLDPQALEEMAKVLQHGAKKYSPHMWRDGVQYSRLYAAALRHMFAWADGEKYDPESQHQHLAHAAVNLMFLINFQCQSDGGKDMSHLEDMPPKPTEP